MESKKVIDTAATVVTRTDGSREIGLVKIEQTDGWSKGTFVTPLTLENGDTFTIPEPLPYQPPPDANDN